jgi:transcription elongation factor GreB
MAKANLITPKGYRLLKEEEDYLWRIERPEITEKVNWAASLGDRSENADYKENKFKLRKIHSRVRYLRKRLESVQVVHYAPVQEGKVFFGAWVSLEDDDGNEKELQIVGSDEIYKHDSPCSVDSPLARALIGKAVDDEVTLETPKGQQTWWVNAIHYRPDDL